MSGTVLRRSLGPAKEVLRGVVRAVHTVLPKRDDAVLCGWPDYEDNVLALERALQRTPVRKVVLLVYDPAKRPPRDLGPKTVLVPKSSLRGWLAFARARYVFFTHRCYAKRFPRDVVSVNLWHGMPIKRTGWLLDGDEGVPARFTVATSPFWAERMRAAQRPTEGVLCTGLPRNDRLFADRAAVWRTLGLDGREDVERLVFWLPTFRRAVRGRVSLDGSPTDTPFEMAGVDPEELNRFLAERRALAIVKPHPMARFAGPATHSHLLIVDDAWLWERELSLYEALGAADVLVSDVSSVTVDFLLLDRPIVHAIDDLSAYRASRGFTIEPVEDCFMGPVASSFDDLLATLDRVLRGEDPESERRAAMRALSHSDAEPGATDRLLRELGLAPAG